MTASADQLLTPDIRAWIGRSEAIQPLEVSRREIVKYAIATSQRNEKYLRGDEAPPMFVYALMFPMVPLERLSPDGLPRRNLQPDLPLKRVMAGGVKSRYFRAVKPGDVLTGTLTLADIAAKDGRTGPLLFVSYTLKIHTVEGEPILEETQTRIAR